ncbi:MAG TPA: hypothetical protein VH643_13200 [Gemmataceae bacterium]|jgi:hypothetical protein
MKQKSPVHSAFRLPASALVLLILAGCEGNHLVQNDPFLGPQAAPKPVAGAGGGAATQTAGGAIPPLPGSISVPNQAALAGGTTQAPDDPRRMRIEAPPVVPVSSPAGAARGVAPGNVQVDGPVPIPDSTSNRTPVPIAQGGLQQTGAAGSSGVPPAPSAGTMTFEQAQQILNQHGVEWQRWEKDRGQWEFQCSRPVPGQTGINTIYKCRASDPLSAVLAAIKKIQEDQH